MKTVTIIFKDPKHTTKTYTGINVVEVHTYRFLELRYETSSEQINLDEIFSFKVQ